MFKRIGVALLLWLVGVGLALADVEINSADQAALDGVRGVGAVMSKKILDERKAHGPFADWADLQKRVKGIGDKNSVKLSEAGLRVNGQAKGGSASASASVDTAATAVSAKPAASSK